jgi:ABC-type transport system involved in multi-copper enzyme maturation permease subunit
MLTELIRFEWRYHTRQPAFYAAAALFLLAGFALTSSGFGPRNLALTSSFVVTETLALASLFSVFAIAIFVAGAVLRDSEYRMEELVFATPVSRFHYLFGRFGGAFAATVTAVAMAPIGMMVATRMPWVDPARVGALHPLVYVGSFVVMVLPTLLFATALLFALAILTRSALATYAASVVVYILYLLVAALTNSPLMAGSTPDASGGALAALLDPFGLSAFFEVTRYWPAAERNRRFVGLQGTLLLNRALWSGVAVAICAITYRAFRFRLLQKGKKKRHDRDTTTTEVAYVPVQSPEGRWSLWPSYLSATRIDVAAAVRGLPSLLLLLLWFVLAVVTIRSDLFGIEYGASLYPTTALIVASLEPPLWIIGIILVIYYAAEVFWREQRYGMAALIDATPVRGAVMVLAKWTTMVVLIALTIAAGIAAGVLVQLSRGFTDFQPLQYLSLFYFVGLPLALYAAAAMAIHSLSPGKYAGLLLVLLFVVVTRRPSMLGLEHALWRYAGGPNVDYSAMYGFDDAIGPFARLMLHWTLMAALLIAIAALSWRGLRDGALDRLRLLGRRARTIAPLLATLLVLLTLTGAWIAYTSRGEESTRERMDWRAEYEKRYRPLAALPLPSIVAVRTDVALFPETRRLHIAGDYTLRNDTARPIRTIDVAARRGARTSQFSMPAARLSRNDTTYGMVRFDLARPLQPGEETTLHFDLRFDGPESPAIGNGSLVMNFLTYPSLGYRSAEELRDPRERARRGLGKPTLAELDEEAVSSMDPFDLQRVRFDATVSTSGGQTAIAPGQLLRTWSADGRRHFHYRSEQPIRNRFAFASARYSVEHRQAGHVDVSIAYHPAHRANVQAMLDTAVKTLAYCDREFGPYPHRQLKLVEAPTSSFGGYAVPDTIFFSEERTFLVDHRDPDGPDLVARRVAHEVAHQWWGHQLVAANRGGALVLTESLAKYTELLLLEQIHGRDAARALLEYELDRYLSGRASATEPERPLMTVIDQPYIYYSKGALVFYAIRDLIGEPALNTALRRLVAEKRGRTATTADLLAQLRAVSTNAQYTLIDRWFHEVGPPRAAHPRSSASTDAARRPAAKVLHSTTQ